MRSRANEGIDGEKVVGAQASIGPSEQADVGMIPLPSKTKRAIKNRMKEWRIAYVRRVHSFGAAELRTHIEGLGVRRGETLLVHSSWNRF